mgnify:CR=1 FL=1
MKLKTNLLEMDCVSLIMKTKLTILIAGFILIFLTPSCRQKLYCPAFDLEEDIVNWHMFPGLESQINYVDSNDMAYSFIQSDYYLSEAYTYKCGRFQKCDCSYNMLTTSYYNSDLDFTLISEIEDVNNNTINFSYDSIYFALFFDLKNNTIHSLDTLYTVTPINTLTVFNTNYTNVFEVTSQLNDFKFWLKKNAGMVAFEKEGMLYKLN